MNGLLLYICSVGFSWIEVEDESRPDLTLVHYDDVAVYFDPTDARRNVEAPAIWMAV